MKLKNILFISVILLTNSYLICLSAQIIAENGKTYGTICEFDSDIFVNDGEIIGDEAVSITCILFKGAGIIKGPKISIKTVKFNFTGTIECDGECEIISEEPINENSFIRVGSGKFTFIVKSLESLLLLLRPQK